MPGKTAARTAAVTSTRDALEGALQTLGTTLEMLPGVTDTQLATTGFDLPRERIRSSEAVAAPGNVRLKLNGMSGEVQVLCDSVPRAKTYQLQYTLDPEAGPWNDGGVIGNTRNMVIKGLTRKEREIGVVSKDSRFGRSQRRRFVDRLNLWEIAQTQSDSEVRN